MKGEIVDPFLPKGSAAIRTYRSIRRHPGGPRLALRFALTVTLGLAITGICVVVVVRATFLRLQKSQAAAHAQLVTDVVLGSSLRADDFASPGAARRAQLDRLFRGKVLSGGTVAAALYSPDGRVAYATGHAAIGTRTAASLAAAAATSGPRVTSRIRRAPVDGRRTKVVEYLLPLRFGHGAPAGVVGLSTDYGSLTRAAARSWLPVSAVVELLVAVLLATLVPTVRRAIGQTRQQVRDAEEHALRDPLTALPNRLLFEDRARQAVAQAQREGATAAVMLVDLDRFKGVNDTRGHAAGDVLLRETAVRLTEVLRETDTVARLGGDEFAIVMPDGSSTTVHETARRLQRAIETPVWHEGNPLSVGASIGIAVFPEHGRTVSSLLRHADIAMYQAKRGGLGHVVFDAGVAARDEEATALTTDLRGALARGELVLHYQPSVEVDTLAVHGVEALLRWNHPLQGTLSADRFMPYADQAGVRTAIHEWALDEAIRQAGAWRRAGVTVSVGVNLDARMLVDADLPRRVERLLERHGVDATQIEAEIAEAALLGDLDRVTAGAVGLAAVGVILVVDDFGADQTSLNSLAYLPIERLKIDRAFLVRALDSGRDRILLASVVDVAHRLGLRTIVAGVEDEEGLELLRELDADYAQGYHLGAPAPAAAIERLLLPAEVAA